MPTFVIIPILLITFVVLAVDHYRMNPEKQLSNIRYLLMVSAVLMMFAQILAGQWFPWLSMSLFVLACLWLAMAVFLTWRRSRTA